MVEIDPNDEIFQDFLIEAGEIIEALSEQLVELESSPEDADLLNAIFRGFHTVKGGAGFLSLESLVAICHISENIFDLLRQGKREVNAALMDVILQAFDSIQEMFAQLQAFEVPSAANQGLLDRLTAIEKGDVPEPSVPDTAIEEEENVASDKEECNESDEVGDEGDITEEEFDALLDELHGGKAPGQEESRRLIDAAEAGKAANSDDISEEEFDALLDELHGDKAPGQAEHQDQTVASGGTEGNTALKEEEKPTSENITEEEFEAYLDQLHGGNAPGTAPLPGVNTAVNDEIKEEPKTPLLAEKQSPAAEKSVKETPKVESTVRLDTALLDDIMNLVGELVLVRNRLKTLSGHQDHHDPLMHKAISNLDIVTSDLQASVMQTRMQPIKKVFGRFPRVVRDLARSLGKEIELVMRGEDTDLDKNLVEALADPLVHLVRNSVDHGIELPDVREKRKKPAKGTVVLSAEQAGDHILIYIEDDGAGMDAEVLRGKAVEKGLMDQETASRLSEKDCFNLIFMPGFSTKQEVSDISGRGVGMDVVKTKINALNGRLEIDSELGKGSRVSIKVPLTLAILPTLMIVLEGQRFALPLTIVSEIFHLELTGMNVVDGQETIIIRDKALPIFFLKDWLRPNSPKDRPKSGHVIIVSVGSQQVGFVIDQLVGQEEVVIKPLSHLLQDTTEGMAGATITGGGEIAMILDVPSLLRHYAKTSNKKA